MPHCLIVAEAGVNHENDPGRAEDYVRAAAACGADAVKFQTYRADSIATKSAAPYWDSHEGQHVTFSRLDKLPWNYYRELVRLGEELGIVVFSTPFDLEAVDMLDEAGVKWFKIASADLTYHRLIEKVASKGKPVILSTGASTRAEVYFAACVLGQGKHTLLHCTLKYPCPPEAIHLRKMVQLKSDYCDWTVGLSDHSLGTAISVAAAALGAGMIEKHFTLSKDTPGASPDHWLSADRKELTRIVSEVRIVEQALGDVQKAPDPLEADAIRYARRSVTSAVHIPANTEITPEMLTCKRPGWGIPATEEHVTAGRIARVFIPADTTMTPDMLWGRKC